MWRDTRTRWRGPRLARWKGFSRRMGESIMSGAGSVVHRSASKDAALKAAQTTWNWERESQALVRSVGSVFADEIPSLSVPKGRKHIPISPAGER